MINSTKLGRWASKCASPSTSNKNRSFLFLIMMLLTFSAGNTFAEGKWVETDICSIVDAQEEVTVIITMTKGGNTFIAMGSRAASSPTSYTPESIEVTINNGILESTPEDNIKWNIKNFQTASNHADAYNSMSFEITPYTTSHSGKLLINNKEPLVKTSSSRAAFYIYIYNKKTLLRYDTSGNNNRILKLSDNNTWTAINGGVDQTLKVFKYVDDLDNTPIYTRDVQPNNFGTICLPYGSSTFTGASFYEIACKDLENGKLKGLTLASVDKLEAGMPYIFQVDNNAKLITVTYDEGEACEKAGYKNGLYGTFTNGTPVESGNYIIHEGIAIAECEKDCWVDANRAYIVMKEVPESYTKMPGRRYIGMGVQGENEATGLDNTTAPEEQIIKVIENGQLIIIRNGEKYNVQGQKL